MHEYVKLELADSLSGDTVDDPQVRPFTIVEEGKESPHNCRGRPRVLWMLPCEAQMLLECAGAANRVCNRVSPTYVPAIGPLDV